MNAVNSDVSGWRWRSLALLCAILPVMFATACATGTSLAPTDSAEAVFPTSEELTRAAVVKVLSEGGYTVKVENDGRRVETDFRREIRSIWDRLVVYRFGTIRSWVEVRIMPQDEASTRVTIDVFCEGKDSLFGSWRAYDTPLPQRASTHLRQMRATLDLL
jgi:hypothetical protein